MPQLSPSDTSGRARTIRELDPCCSGDARPLKKRRLGGPPHHYADVSSRAALNPPLYRSLLPGQSPNPTVGPSGRPDLGSLNERSLDTAAAASTGTRRYASKRPEFWREVASATGSRLYPTIVSVGRLGDGLHAPILILTRRPLPELDSFLVFSAGFEASVILRGGTPLDLSTDLLDTLYGYTLRVCRAITNKPFTSSQDTTPYLFAPLDSTWSPDESIDNHIPWDLVELAAKNFVVPLLQDSTDVEAIVRDSIVQDRKVEFTNRFFVKQLRCDLTPLSKANDSPREAQYANFLEYCKARIKDFAGLKDERQALIEVSVIPSPTNYLNPMSGSLIPPSKVPVKYLIPELCAKFTIPASTFRTMMLLPSILRRIDDQLLTKELNARFFRNSIRGHYLLTALTPPVATAAFDYERLELLGDALLKYVASIYCFVTSPAAHESALHETRQKIISNRSLLSGAIHAGLPPYIQSKPFVAKMWQPIPTDAQSSNPNATTGIPLDQQDAVGDLQNKPKDDSAAEAAKPKTKRSKTQRHQDEQDIQWLGAKTIADVVEAIIGAGYLSGGHDAALDVMKTLRIDIPLIQHWSDFVRKASAPSPTATQLLPAARLRAVQEILHCEVKVPGLLAQALTHSSAEIYDATCYDRLEFLGDAVLDFLVVRYIFDRHPALGPGGLSLLKSAMVSNHTLAAICVHTGLHEHIRYSASNIGAAVRGYVNKLQALKQREYQVAAIESRAPGQYWLAVDPPKILSDVIESTIGAVYVSDGFTDAGASKFFDRVLRPFYDSHISLQSVCAHPTTTLFEVLQSYECHRHGMVKEKAAHWICCDVVVHDVVLARAEDVTIAAAVRNAATFALDALDGDPDFMARTCDCRATQPSKKAKKLQKSQLGYELEGSP